MKARKLANEQRKTKAVNSHVIRKATDYVEGPEYIPAKKWSYREMIRREKANRS